MHMLTIVQHAVLAALLCFALTISPSGADEQKTPVVPAGVTVYSDLVYAHRAPAHDLKLDLYVPSGAASKPLIVWIHGGGWAMGSRKEWVHPLFFVNCGFAVATVDYRFSSQAHFPAQILDCKAAVRYLRARAGEYGLDPKRFVATGESAGGNLASLLATTGDDPVFTEPGDSTSDTVQAAIDICGPSDFTTTPDTGPDGTAPYYIGKLLGQPPSQCPDLARQASPVFHISAKTPPIFVMHASGDDVCPVSQSQEFYAALQKANVPTDLVVVPVNAHVGPFFWTEEMQGKMEAFLHRSLNATGP